MAGARRPPRWPARPSAKSAGTSSRRASSSGSPAGSLLVGPDHPDAPLNESRIQTWRDLTDSARVQYSWPEPGAPRSAWATFPRMPPDSAHPLPNFCLLLLEPTEVDHLELNGTPQNRWHFLRAEDGLWTIQELNP